MTWDQGQDRRSSYTHYDTEIGELKRRCQIKEDAFRALSLQVATLEAKVESLQITKLDQEYRIKELNAWKNKQLGYMGAFVVLTGFVIEGLKTSFKDIL